MAFLGHIFFLVEVGEYKLNIPSTSFTRLDFDDGKDLKQDWSTTLLNTLQSVLDLARTNRKFWFGLFL